MNVIVYSRIHEMILADTLDLPEPTRSELYGRGLYRVALETPFPDDYKSFKFVFYMTMEEYDAGRINNMFMEEVPMEVFRYRRRRATPSRSS